MKKTILIICFLCLANFNLIAQTESEREKIKESYDVEKISQLKVELKEYNLLRKNRITSFFKANKSFSRKYKSDGKVYDVYDIVDGKPVYRSTHNLNSAKATKTDRLQSGGSLGLNLEGQNMIIAVWDENSVLGTHDEFKDNQIVPQSRVSYPELGIPSALISDHATHVAGTLIGKGAVADAKGMAPQANLQSFNWGDDDIEALDEATNGLLISNHSYGVPIFSNGAKQVSSENIGSYGSDARRWDDVAFNAPYYLAVNSAGNEGNEVFFPVPYTDGLATSGYDKLTGNKTAKNNLVVANANPLLNPGNGNLLSLSINAFSSQGPTDDFRIKPDIAGDGTAVLSSVSVIPTNNPPRPGELYDRYNGTSMASPNVAGTLLLLQQYYNQLNSNYMRAATIKALVCHTAIDDNGKVGPDPIFGWGLLNAEAAANTIKDDKDQVATIKELTLNNSGTYTYNFSATASGPLSATICWTDPAGTTSSSPANVLSPRLVNDLDLRLEDSGSNISMPWKLDNTDVTASAIKGDNEVDNIERIDIASSVSGNYTLTVTHKGSLTNGSQAFSLILTGANLTLSASDKFISSIAVWPNPTEGKLNLSFNSVGNKSKISLYDIHGREVYKENLETNSSKINHSINTEAFYSGIYFLNIQDGNAVYNKKIIIK